MIRQNRNMVELWFLLISITMLCMFIYWRQHDPIEAFENSTSLEACPSGYKSFYQSNGSVLCCDGDIMANQCMGNHPCTLSGPGTPDLPNCSAVIQKDYQNKGEQCPTSMPSYFEDRASNKKGCTTGDLNSTLTGPKETKQPTCMIYPTMDQNANEKNSCSNQKEMDDFPCFGSNCTKELVQVAPNQPIKISVGFTDSSGMHHVAYTRASMERFLNVSNPKWRDQGIDLSKNINVAEVAKALYVDKTVSQDDIQI